MSTTTDSPLFPDESRGDPHVVYLNDHCRVTTIDGFRVVSVCGVVLAHYAIDDRLSEANTMVTLVAQGYARQTEVSAGFGCCTRTVRRHIRRYDEGGLSALGRGPGYPRGRPRVSPSREKQVNDLKAEGKSNREIARRIGVTEKAVRKLLKRLGWRFQSSEQLALHLDDQGADPNLSALKKPTTDGNPAEGSPEETKESSPVAGADPNLSGSDDCPAEVLFSLDVDPADRSVDRFLASKNLLDDAIPMFRAGQHIPHAGALLAIPAIVESGAVEVARRIYGSIGPAFYGLRTTILTFLLMALMRIKHPEGLKEWSPIDLGRLLGLDRAPEVKTVRRKLARLAALRRAVEFGRALAAQRISKRGHALGFLYVDGHVRVYHGTRKLPKTHVARKRLAMPATTDYWINDSEGDPILVINTEAHKGMVKMLSEVTGEIRALLGDRRVTIVFDRGGWSPKLFKKLIPSGFDILTYRKGRWRKVAKKSFSLHQATFNGREVEYQLADQNVLLLKRKLKLRQVTVLTDDGHQTPILTSRTDLPAIEVAYRMFERWRQENFFKYMRQEFALDALVDYSTEPADPTRDVPNPARKKVDAELRKAKEELTQVESALGIEAILNPEGTRPTMRGFKIANATIAKAIRQALRRVIALEQKRASIPTRVPVRAVTEGDVIKLRTEVKLITDLLKMVAYQAECDMVRLIAPHYRRSEHEGRTLIQSALGATGDIDIDTSSNKLLVALEPLSSPHRTQALVALCDEINQTQTKFPGTKLRMLFEVKPQPDSSLAFPGPRPNLDHDRKPDK